MLSEKIISAGIDIGTSTTQLIFSELTLANTGGFGSVPKIEVVEKKILYRSKIHNTPLISVQMDDGEDEIIDGAGVAEIIKKEYELGKMKPSDLATGAVIITGESARKRNAKEVLQEISEYAGDFVVAAAGADLESVLSGKGSGAAALSVELGKLVANFDIGGGTTNISFFENGEVVDTACLNIGGRLVQVSDQLEITRISPTLKPLLIEQKLNLSAGMKLEPAAAIRITRRMAELIAEAVGYRAKTELLQEMITNHGITCGRIPHVMTFSGGVADCMGKQMNPFQFLDLGVLLAISIQENMDFEGAQIVPSEETVNATVVGAGNYSMEVSGSTISYQNYTFPMKNLSVFSFRVKEGNTEDFRQQLLYCKKRIGESEIEMGKGPNVISFSGIPCPSFVEIETLAEIITESLQEEIANDQLPIIIVEEDIGKVLGQAIRRRIGKEKKLLCLDGVHASEGDFVDIGEPVAGGKVVPVVVKTLIFDVGKRA